MKTDIKRLNSEQKVKAMDKYESTNEVKENKTNDRQKDETTKEKRLI